MATRKVSTKENSTKWKDPYVTKIAKKQACWFPAGDALKLLRLRVAKDNLRNIFVLYSTYCINELCETDNLYTACIMHVNLQTVLPSKFAKVIWTRTCIFDATLSSYWQRYYFFKLIIFDGMYTMCEVHICLHNLHLFMLPLPLSLCKFGQNFLFQVRSSNYKKWQLRHICPSVCPLASLEPLDSHRTDIHAIWYWVLFGNLSRIFKSH
jgi:hypothetical protein